MIFFCNGGQVSKTKINNLSYFDYDSAALLKRPLSFPPDPIYAEDKPNLPKIKKSRVTFYFRKQKI